MMRESETQTFSEVLRDLFEEEPDLHEDYLGHQALGLLPSVLGAGLRYVSGVAIQDGTLILRVCSSVAKQHFLSEAERIIRQINDSIGVELVRDIRLY